MPDNVINKAQEQNHHHGKNEPNQNSCQRLEASRVEIMFAAPISSYRERDNKNGRGRK
jgi:hypothetical protein